MPYCGNEITVTTPGWGEKPVLTLSVNGETKILNEESDYTVSYLKNTAKGTATIVFTGIGGYSETLKKNFTIKAYDIGADSADR